MKPTILLLLCLLSLSASAAEINLYIHGFQNDEGRLRFSMFGMDARDHFPMHPEQGSYILDTQIKNRQAYVQLSGIEPGPYAIIVYHDQNGNSKLDHKWYGPPKESLGYYHNYTLRMIPPNFEEVMFELPDSGVKIEILLQSF